MKNLLLSSIFSFIFAFSSNNVLANHCSGGHDKGTETSTSTSEESKETEKK